MKKNVIFYFSDQQRWDTIGVYGQALNITPNLDQMALEGIIFDNAFSCQPVCGPARSCVQSGLYATKTGCFVNGISLPQNIPTIAKEFNNAGYETAYVGKWHLASDDGVEEYHYAPIPLSKRGGYQDYWMASDALELTSHGYDGYVFDKDMNKIEFEGYRVDKITDYALDFLDSRNTEKPFFLFLSHIEPHHQNDHKCYEGPEGSKEKFKDYILPEDLNSLNNGDAEESYPDYLGACYSLDQNLGRIRDKLRKLQIEEDTIIIYTSDHGCHFRTRNKNMPPKGGDDYKRSPYDSATHIPMIIYGLENTPQRITTAVSLIDLPATLLEIINTPTDAVDGIPLQEFLSSNREHSQQERFVFIQISESMVGRAIRSKDWLYAIFAPSKNPWKDKDSDRYQDYLLIDVSKDPHQLNNLINDPNYQEKKEELRKILAQKIMEIENIEVLISS